MPRPAKYTDSDIAAAIQALIVDGDVVNPMRVRARLGGGNVGRIKAVINARSANSAPTAGSGAQLPEGLSREFERLSLEASQQIKSIASKCWATARAASTDSQRDENIRLRREVDSLERDLVIATDRIGQIERQREEQERALSAQLQEKAELAQVHARLQSALRNAESDLRAAQRVIDTFERNQRQDRDDIRGLQKRIEGLVGEIAVLKQKRPKLPP